jgi:hypothetical protein
MAAKETDMTSPERLAIQMGLDIPDFDRDGYYGADYGTMKPFHRVGSLLFLSGHVAQRGTEISHKGRLGADVTVDEGYQAARRTGLNVLGGIRQAVGSLDRVKGIVRSLNFVVCTPEFEEVHKVSSGLSGPVPGGFRARARAGRPGDHRRDGAGERGLLRDLGHGRGGIGPAGRITGRAPARWPVVSTKPMPQDAPGRRPSAGGARRARMARCSAR